MTIVNAVEEVTRSSHLYIFYSLHAYICTKYTAIVLFTIPFLFLL